jgi:hydrogenase maturation factor
VAAVVPIVRVEVCAVVPLRVTDVGERLHVAGLLEAVGLMEHVRLTVPKNPPDPGVTVMVEVFPVVAPGATETPAPAMVKVAPGALLMVTEKPAVAVFDAESVNSTVKLAMPAVSEEPDRTPPLDRLRPAAGRLLPLDVTVQL